MDLDEAPLTVGGCRQSLHLIHASKVAQGHHRRSCHGGFPYLTLFVATFQVQDGQLQQPRIPDVATASIVSVTPLAPPPGCDRVTIKISGLGGSSFKVLLRNGAGYYDLEVVEERMCRRARASDDSCGIVSTRSPMPSSHLVAHGLPILAPPPPPPPFCYADIQVTDIQHRLATDSICIWTGYQRLHSLDLGGWR